MTISYGSYYSRFIGLLKKSVSVENQQIQCELFLSISILLQKIRERHSSLKMLLKHALPLWNYFRTFLYYITNSLKITTYFHLLAQNCYQPNHYSNNNNHTFLASTQKWTIPSVLSTLIDLLNTHTLKNWVVFNPF